MTSEWFSAFLSMLGRAPIFSPLCSGLHIPICEPWCWNMHTNICPKVQNHHCRFLYASTMVRIWVYHKPSYIIYHKCYILSIGTIYYPSYIHLGCNTYARYDRIVFSTWMPWGSVLVQAPNQLDRHEEDLHLGKGVLGMALPKDRKIRITLW